MMLRIEAGLPLIDVEWHNSRLAFTDHDRVTPKELGMGWMLRGVRDGDRRLRRPRRDPPRAGRRARRAGPRSASSSTGRTGTGCTAPPACCPTKDEQPLGYESVLHDRPTTAGGSQVGYVTSFCYSPVLQRHIGLARVRPEPRGAGDRGAPGDRPEPRQHDRARAHREAAPVQPREEDGPTVSQAMSSTSTGPYDAIVVGGGHNGLVNAATSPRPGCAPWSSSSATSSAARRSPRSWCPGSPFTTFSYALSLLRPEIIHELDLVEHGFLPLMMPSSFHPTGDGDYLLLGDDHGQNIQEIRRHSRARRRRLRPLPPRPRPGLPGDPAALRQRAARRLRQGPRGPGRRRSGCSTTSAASTGR